MSISKFLANSVGREFIWGQYDCALWIADLVKQETGIDAAAKWRGTYSTARECIQIIRKAGGLVDLISPEFAMLHPLGKSQNGVVIAQVGRRDFCGILHNGFLFARSDPGICLVKKYTLKVGWSCLS